MSSTGRPPKPPPIKKVEEPKISHTASVKSIKITSVTALRSAIESLAATGMKISLKENATPRAFYPNQVGLGKADFVIELKDSRYDVGVYKSATENSYEVRTDFWGSDVEKVLGVPATSPEKKDQARLGRLFQAYGVAAAKETARKRGHMVQSTTREDGTIVLSISGPGL